MGGKGIDAAILAYEEGLALSPGKKQKKTKEKSKATTLATDIDLLDLDFNDALAIDDISSLLVDSDDFEFMDEASANSLEDL